MPIAVDCSSIEAGLTLMTPVLCCELVRLWMSNSNQMGVTMANLAVALKAEIQRLARKEIRAQMGVTKRSVAQHRQDIAELKRQNREQGRKLAFLESQEKGRLGTAAPENQSKGIRFSPKWLKAHRSRLGLSAADYGKLIGVSSLTIYNWEQGKAQPRAGKLAALASVRTLGKREIGKRLEMLGS